MNWDTSAIPPPPTFFLMNFGSRYGVTNDNNNNDLNLNKFNFTPDNVYDYQNQFYSHNFFNETYNYTDFDITMQCSSNQNSVSNVISMILYAIVCIVGLFGNTLVIYVVLRFSKMQTVTNIYILNLAFADECYLIGIPFLLITIHLGHWTFGEAMCKLYMVSTSITQFTSSIFLFIMSADRYIAICHPVASQRIRTPLISKIVSIIAWMTSAIIMLPVILFSSTIEYEKSHYSCIIKWPEDHGTESGTTFTLYALVLGFAIPLSFILIFYCLVLKKLHTIGIKNKSKGKKKSHRKVTKLVLTVITVYILCWLPHWISQVALIHSSPHKCRSKLEITIFLLVGCLGYSNSAMNPILYTFLSDNFKKSFVKAFVCKHKNNNDINAQIQMDNSILPKFLKNRFNDNGNGNGNDCNINNDDDLGDNGGSQRLIPSEKLNDKTNMNLSSTNKIVNNFIINENNSIIMPKLKETIINKNSTSTNNTLITNLSSITQNNDLRSGVLHTDL